MNASRRDEIVQLTRDLIVFESTAERPDQLHAVIDYVAAYVARIPGLHVSRHERGGKPALVATLHPTRRPKLFLNAHLDVVPARPEQFQPTMQGDRLYGRGSQDMKGSGAVLLRLLKDLAALEARPDVGFQFVSDEEIGGANGVGYLVEQGYHCEFFLAAEPTDLNICYAHKGLIWLEVRLGGDPAHGSRPWDGRNAILSLRDGLARLEARFPTPDAALWRTTVTPTVVAGGSATNRLPEQVVLKLDCRRVPDDDPALIAAAIQECFLDGEVVVGGSGSPLQTNPDNAFVQQLASLARTITGAQPQLYGEHYASDARYYTEVGIPAVCFGPIGKGLHSDEEWVDVPSLETLYVILRDLALG